MLSQDADSAVNFSSGLVVPEGLTLAILLTIAAKAQPQIGGARAQILL